MSRMTQIAMAIASIAVLATTAGCLSSYKGEAQIGVGQQSTNEFYVYHRVVKDADETGSAGVDLQFQALVDYFVQLKEAGLIAGGRVDLVDSEGAVVKSMSIGAEKTPGTTED